jgi:hypothetical protein
MYYAIQSPLCSERTCRFTGRHIALSIPLWTQSRTNDHVPLEIFVFGPHRSRTKFKDIYAAIGPTSYLVVSSFNDTRIAPSAGVSAAGTMTPRTKHITAAIHIARSAPPCMNPYLAARSIWAGVRRLGNGDATKEEGGG